jgi:preprotein translocase subunit SecE
MKEWHRTVILVILLVAAIGSLIWLQDLYKVNFTDRL